ncbi:MBL fold metallo-hydrolase [Dactylosporangium roseum]|uniref:MBL fold metallo-hydrolase n=1 Tax=Dactylosporangium roseum TaxID=47989 RepID=A0ABY5YX82_9ACTN|nr:MBL fold metallo-hydrolase [Dactylosporangium roseum]UWZ34360.1 MBL fold metallo-hydrolase [Dactylosporangium roseum]
MRAFTGTPRLQEVADGVHAFLQPDGGWCLNNGGVIVDGGSAVLVDTAATEARARRLRDLVRAVVPAAPRIVVNTHAHGDHTFGNFVFPEAVVVGAELTRAEVLDVGLHLTKLWPDVQWGDIELAPPQMTFTGRLTLHLADRVAELHTFGPAHTVCDTVVWLPRERVLFTGDLVMSGVTPLVLSGSVGGLRDAVAALRRFGAETIVPGHGAPGGPELLGATERYLDLVLELAEAGLAERRAPVDVARGADLGEFAGLVDRERLVPNLYRAYAELRGGPEPAAGVDEIFGAMVELHGGLPACHA